MDLVASKGACKVSASVDWWRVASRANSTALQLLQASRTVQQGLFSQGHEAFPWRFEGYDGEKIASVFVGTRQGDVLLNASGNWAHVACIATKSVAERATRIDLAIDLEFGGDYAELAKEQVEVVEQWQRDTPRRAHPKPLLIDGRGQGDTFYLGSRNSGYLIRLYDKAREQKARARLGWWRLEIQFNKDYCPQVLSLLKSSQAEAETCYHLARSFAMDHGFTLPLPSAPYIALQTPKSPPTSLEKKLNWLRHHVRGSVQELIKAGYDEEVWKALFDIDNHSQDEDAEFL
jgi:DNA relaxase NicK